MVFKARYLAAIVAILLVVSGTVVAEDRKVAVAGIGSNSCGRFLTSTDGDAQLDELANLAYVSWAQAFLSGLNYDFVLDGELGPIVDLSDSAGQEIWLKNFCKEYPLESFFGAALGLWFELRETQGLGLDPRFLNAFDIELDD